LGVSVGLGEIVAVAGHADDAHGGALDDEVGDVRGRGVGEGVHLEAEPHAHFGEGRFGVGMGAGVAERFFGVASEGLILFALGHELVAETGVGDVVEELVAGVEAGACVFDDALEKLLGLIHGASLLVWHDSRNVYAKCREFLTGAGGLGRGAVWVNRTNRKDVTRLFRPTGLIADAFRAADVKYRIVEREDCSIAEATVGGRNIGNVQVYFISDSPDNDFSLRVYSFVRVPEARRAGLLPLLNTLNQRYRYLCFTLDEDGDVNVSCDAPAALTDPGPAAHELLRYTARVLDDVYPIIMRALYAE